MLRRSNFISFQCLIGILLATALSAPALVGQSTVDPWREFPSYDSEIVWRLRQEKLRAALPVQCSRSS